MSTLRAPLPIAATSLLACVFFAAPAGAQGQSLITNGTFDTGMTPWWESIGETAAATVEATGGELCATMTAPGDNPWDVVIGIDGLAMSAGRYYRARLSVRADAERTFRFKTGLGVAPYTDYFLHQATATATTSTVEVTFLNVVDDPATQFQFHVGGANGTICFDDVVLEPVAAPDGSSYESPSLTGYRLRDYPNVVKVGTAIETGTFLSSQEHDAIVAGELNMVTPGNAMKMGPLVGTRGEYDWSIADAMVDFAEQAGLDFHGHALVWHRQAPQWLEEGTFSR